MLHDQRFRKHERLTRRSDFDRVFAERCAASDDLMIVYVASNDLPWSRLGLSVSRRVGGAVRRNYVRRRIREAFRTNKAELPKGYDIICSARPKAADRDANVGKSLGALLVKAVRRYQDRGYGSRHRTNPGERT